MDINHLKHLTLISASGLIFISAAVAGRPMWTFAPVSGFPPAVFMTNLSETATI
ncbi:hypothetical protein [uncultured Legionella sp.]|uniref:hypothetical protein n=1 Tax=uncultured Legionella sp. TaxID=210934 RepID=UPI0026395A26|nr:hypothetical protein [uncultured Legionella sp.]